MQGGDLAEVKVYPLLGDRDVAALSTFIHKELNMSKHADGFDAPAEQCLTNKCWNLWSVYQHHRTGAPARRSPKEQASPQQQLPHTHTGACGFGAPLVASALQRLGVLADSVDPASLLPVQLPLQRLLGGTRFATPITVRRN